MIHVVLKRITVILNRNSDLLASVPLFSVV